MHTLQDAQDAGGVRKAQEAEALGIPKHPRLSDPSDTPQNLGGLSQPRRCTPNPCCAQNLSEPAPCHVVLQRDLCCSLQRAFELFSFIWGHFRKIGLL